MNWSNRISTYSDKLQQQMKGIDPDEIKKWSLALQRTWREGRQLLLCGNGGSAANAIHLANDFLYGINPGSSPAIRVLALPANASVLTCLGNDIGYDAIFSQQLKTLGRAGDLLMVFSGSGNSPNVVRALETAKQIGIETFAILGFSGGACKNIANHVLHFQIDDMQVAEDLQVIVGHMLMQWLLKSGPGS
jgi:D-sedoheptulose 7-phosphate isomerase